jgi:molybdenum cofactor cytidylyltransferase
VLLLAAGSSSRMGFPKQLLKWNNTTLLQHTIHTVKHVDQDETILVLGAHFEDITSQIDVSETTVVFNENWEKGLGNSIACGMNYVKHSLPQMDCVLILLADQPLIDANFLNEIIKTHKKNPDHIICTQYEHHKSGVPALFNNTYFEELSQLNHDKGAKDLLKRHPKDVLFLNAMHLISDIDTMEDYEKLYKQFH